MGAGVDDPERLAVGAEPSVLRTYTRCTEGSAAEQAERSVGGDRIAGDAVAGSVNREEELSVVA